MFLVEGSTAVDLSKCWRREVAPVVAEAPVEGDGEEEVAAAAAMRAACLRASSSSSLSSILTSILLGFLLSISLYSLDCHQEKKGWGGVIFGQKFDI